MSQKVMVVGSGGREHALALRLLESGADVGEVVVVPGNAGTARAPARLSPKILRNVTGGPLDVAARERPALVVVGPEAPLVAGLADELTARGFLTFGPSRAAAELEGSKSFMKAFAERHGIPTARHLVVHEAAELERAIASFETPPVVKADGLCAGKGVVVAESHEEARVEAEAMLRGRFGAAGAKLVLEERLLGAEASVHALCDGERFTILPAAQDHKRIFDADQGPNTGGMGTYAPAPLVTPEIMASIAERVFAPTLRGMAAEGRPYRGVLFAGLMIEPSGNPRLIEFNVRFGDPETQVLMASTCGDLAVALASVARGELVPDAIRASGEHALCVVLAAHGYPGEPRKGDAITGLGLASQVEGVEVIHAGTALDAHGQVVTAGGRVLGVTARAGSLAIAYERAYSAVSLVNFLGMQFRRDIAARALR